MKSKMMFISIVLCAASSSIAFGKTVATCGSYLLNQDVSSGYFAGILHQTNTYEIVDPSGDSLEATIEVNSEGAVLKASKNYKNQPENTAVLESRNLTITAAWNIFELLITDSDGTQVKIGCVKN